MITEALPKSGAHKFSLATPLRVATTYLRILDHITGGCPSSVIIIQDRKKLVASLEVIRTAGRAIVEGVGNRGSHTALNFPH
jgi:hypothetical protein